MKGIDLIKGIADGSIKEGQKVKCIYNHIYTVTNYGLVLSDNTNPKDELTELLEKTFICLEYILNNEFTIVQDKRSRFVKPNAGDRYWYVTASGYIASDTWCNADVDNYRFNYGSCYPTEQDAIDAERAKELKFNLEKFSYENGGSEIDWNKEGQQKWYIYHRANDTNTIHMGYINTQKCFEETYFISESVAKQAIDTFRTELEWYFKEYRQ